MPEIPVTEKNTKIVLYDFDGTLSDSIDACIAILQAMDDNIPSKISKDILRTHTSEDIFKLLQIHWWQVPFYVKKFRELQEELDPIPKLFPWSAEIITKTLDIYGSMWIVSSTTANRIKKSLVTNDISLDNIHIYADVGIFEKNTLFTKIANSNHTKPENLLYVGDETRDAQAAKKARINFLGVDWGLHNADLLEQVHNYPVAYNNSELLNYIESFYCKN